MSTIRVWLNASAAMVTTALVSFAICCLQKKRKNTTVMAHNGAGYDNMFILQYCLDKGLVRSSFIRQGSRIAYMCFRGFMIRFIDSYHFLSQPLKDIPKTYGIDTLKGFTQHSTPLVTAQQGSTGMLIT